MVSIIWTLELILGQEWTTLSWWWETKTVYMCEVWLGESGTYLEMQFSLSVITRYFSQLQLRARSNLSLPTNNNHIIHSVFGRVGRLVSSQSVRVSGFKMQINRVTTGIELCLHLIKTHLSWRTLIGCHLITWPDLMLLLAADELSNLMGRIVDDIVIIEMV